jgi:hypothetical protein
VPGEARRTGRGGIFAKQGGKKKPLRSPTNIIVIA